jgi:anti-sigma factor RsiW
MKTLMDSWADARMDEFLFEYLEGTLSEEQATELEQRLATDSTLRQELEHWKEAFVDQDFYDTQLLEESLRQPTTRRVTIPASAFLVALLTLVLSVFPTAVVKERTVAVLPVGIPAPAVAPAISEMATVTKPPQPAVSKPRFPRVPSTHRKPAAMLPPRAASENVSPVEKIQPRLIPPGAGLPTADLSALETKMTCVRLEKAAVARVQTRKQRRKIERMKEKARQERAANEFLKGQAPYVVPLNTNNF